MPPCIWIFRTVKFSKKIKWLCLSTYKISCCLNKRGAHLAMGHTEIRLGLVLDLLQPISSKNFVLSASGLKKNEFCWTVCSFFAKSIIKIFWCIKIDETNFCLHYTLMWNENIQSLLHWSTLMHFGHYYQIMSQYLITRPSNFVSEASKLHGGVSKKLYN